MGEFTFPEEHKNKITVLVNPEEKTLKFIDTGLGMDADEVEEYINQIAFSGATDFLAKYKDKTNEDQIIGHFGLGFYSAFMVADEVHIDTLSYKEGATPVHWECDGGTEFSMTDADKAEVGTTITLFLNEESVEFANEYRAREVIQKYCSFMPTEIFLFKEGEEIGAFDVEPEVEVVEEGEEANETPKKTMPVSLSDTTPLWTKHPNECEKEQYLEFYRKVFHDYKEPLFWIHLNMDYPFNLKGILYFPKINTEYDSIEGTIKLYNNQVFIADNIKEVIPEFLMLLKGVIDCPDLPLNVSRSALQNDGFVKKISDYITKKVADRLSGMCKTQRDDYEKYWDDINPFIKFECIKDEKFSNKMMDYILYKDIDGKYQTLKDMLPEEVEVEVVEEGKEDEKKPTTIFYVTDEIQQSQYINMFRTEGKNAVILRHNIDSAFVTHVERANETVHFQRIDADLTDDFKETVSEEEMRETTDALTELFRKALDNENLQIKVEKLKNEEVSSMVTLSEESRRMQEMMRMYGMPGMDPSMFGGDETLVLNANNQLVQYVLANKEGEHTNLFCEQLYDLAMISHKPLTPEAMTKFIARSNKIMMLLTK